jgi:hypothetical protein
MSTTDTVAPSSDESQALLDGGGDDSSPQPRCNSGSPIGIGLAAHVYTVSMEALEGYTYLFLIFVPVGIIIGGLRLNPIASSILNLIAIIPLSALISHSADLLSDSVGELIGGLINATFGNAVELIVCLFSSQSHWVLI